LADVNCNYLAHHLVRDLFCIAYRSVLFGYHLYLFVAVLSVI